MISLPPDLQLEIIKFLAPDDVLYLQLTCKYFHDLIEDAATVVWHRESLRQHCERNLLFWPSYSHLSTASDCKNALTAPMRFTKSYERAARMEGGFMASTRTEIRLPHNNESREWEVPSFRYIHLIRGGRFLLAIIKDTLSATSSVHIIPTRTPQRVTSCNTSGRAESRCLPHMSSLAGTTRSATERTDGG
ncbi:hypothetical protein FA13DRAFT_393233 [Coprinellus micaceus]|uniref:F-box domain-containing protein n=1 Tax=Coprinellus micaceus TaxID=71717 RepID=A0A4Y7TX13_COPMI|nr:hypothetical protein FA13DRAFT_393233 [Coprinellus micaceus]